jgi:hypothetical protein
VIAGENAIVLLARAVAMVYYENGIFEIPARSMGEIYGLCET